MADLISFLFWEKQEGNLCAQHCLNSLLQGEFFTAVDLSEIGHKLDQAEIDKMVSSDQQQQNMSQNMDDSGFFSVQVLNVALKVWNIEMAPIGSEEGRGSRSHPEDEVAYICNLNEHWFTLRKFGGHSTRWYNLDSLLKEPEWISPTYLGMLLSQLETNGYSIFVMKGDLPISEADEVASKLPDKKDEDNLQEIDQKMIDAAIAASLGLTVDENNNLKDNDVNDVNDDDVMKRNNNDDNKDNVIINQPTIEELRAKRLARFGSDGGGDGSVDNIGNSEEKS
jgi:ataxin-3